MKTRRLGANGPDVSAIGLGCMSFAGFFGETDEETSLHCLDAAVDAGINFLDTANVYGLGRSENVIGKWLAQKPRDVLIATKGGITRQSERPVDNAESYLRVELEGSLSRLGVEHVTLYYAHRRAPDMPPEDLAGTMKRFMDEGKIGGYGLSEVSPATLRRAHAEVPCMAVQSEYSLWTRLPDLGMIQACADLGVAFVPFSPLARGVLTDSPPDPNAMLEGDFRLQIPRFNADNYPRNLAAIAPFQAFAAELSRSTEELALAWVLGVAPHLIPIPGTRTAAHLSAWVNAADRPLSADEIAKVETILSPGFAHGDRYSRAQSASVELYC